MISKPAFGAIFNRLFINCATPSQVWKGNGKPPTGFVSMEDFLDEYYQLFRDKEEGQVRETINEWIRTSEDRFFPYPRELSRMWATLFGGLSASSRAKQDREDIDQQNKKHDERYQRIKDEVESWPKAMQVVHKNRAHELFTRDMPKTLLDMAAELGPFMNIGKKIYFIKAYEEMVK